MHNLYINVFTSLNKQIQTKELHYLQVQSHKSNRIRKNINIFINI